MPCGAVQNGWNKNGRLLLACKNCTRRGSCWIVLPAGSTTGAEGGGAVSGMGGAFSLRIMVRRAETNTGLEFARTKSAHTRSRACRMAFGAWPNEPDPSMIWNESKALAKVVRLAMGSSVVAGVLTL